MNEILGEKSIFFLNVIGNHNQIQVTNRPDNSICYMLRLTELDQKKSKIKIDGKDEGTRDF